MTDQEVGVLAIGAGPANLALAVAIEESGSTELAHNTLLLEQSPDIKWQRNLLMPWARSQVSFLNFLHDQDRRVGCCCSGCGRTLPVLVTAAVVLVVPVVWGGFVWGRSLVGALLIVVAAAAYARAGTVHRTLFGALVVSAVVLLTATVHQLTHARAINAFDGSVLLAVTVVVACLAACAEVESWHEDWVGYGLTVRSVAALSAIALAALVAQTAWVGSWVAVTRRPRWSGSCSPGSSR